MVAKAGSILVGCLLCLGLAARTAPPDALEDLNASFREAYATARTGAFERQGAVLVVSGDNLSLYRDQTLVAEAVIRPPLYHSLKTLAHVPLATRLLAGPWAGGALPPEAVPRLESLRARIAAAREDLAQRFAAPAVLQRQRLILDASQRFLDGVLDSKAVGGRALDAYTRAMRPPIRANIREAAVLELEALDRLVPAWRRAHLAGQWPTVKVVVIGSHMARAQEVSWQYFSRLLGQNREGGRLVFAEEKWDPREAMHLLASHKVDRGLGEAFFGDPMRLHRDVLGDAAKIWLDSHAPER